MRRQVNRRPRPGRRHHFTQDEIWIGLLCWAGAIGFAGGVILALLTGMN